MLEVFWQIKIVHQNEKPVYFLSIPKETSHNLRQLLLALLQRNHKDRISFGETPPFNAQIPPFQKSIPSTSYIWISPSTDEFFHHPFLETSSSTKKCTSCVLLVSVQLRASKGAAAGALTQARLFLTGSPAPALSYPSSGSASSSSSSSTSHLASPQVCTPLFSEDVKCLFFCSLVFL